MSEMKVKTHSGVDIFVGENGKFFAHINGRVVSRTQLRDLEKLIVAEAAPVKALYVTLTGIAEPEVIDITTVDASGTMRGKNRMLVNDWRCRAYQPDAAALAELKQLVTEKHALQARWDAVLSRLRPMTREHVQQAQAAQKVVS